MSSGSTVGFAARAAQGDPVLTRGLNANASVRYTAQAHPGSWAAAPGNFHRESTVVLSSSCDFCFGTVFRGEKLEDGGAIIGYDAIVTAVTAIRSDQGNVVNDKPELVSQELKRLHGPDAVPGAAGWISLDSAGNPVNKAVAILQVRPDGSLVFLELSSARGSPCVPGVPPC